MHPMDQSFSSPVGVEPPDSVGGLSPSFSPTSNMHCIGSPTEASHALVYISLSVFTGYISLEVQRQARLRMEENFWVKYLFGPIVRLRPRLRPDPIAPPTLHLTNRKRVAAAPPTLCLAIKVVGMVIDLQGKPTVGEVWGCGTTPTATIFTLEASGVVHVGESRRLLEPAPPGCCRT